MKRVAIQPAPRPVSERATWAMACGAVGLVLPLVAPVAIFLGAQVLRRGGADRPRGERILAITAIATGVLGLVAIAFYAVMIWLMLASASHAAATARDMEVASVQQDAAGYARRNGAYPAHVAEMLLEPNRWVALHDHVRDRTRPVPAMVGTYDLACFAANDEASRSALRAAIGAIDEGQPFYQLGEVWFARLPAPTRDAAIVFAWFRNRYRGTVTVIMDDGSVRPIAGDGWTEIWRADAAARAARGLPAVAPPEMP
jgi:hypothetical protein